MTRNVLALALLFSFSSAAWALQADPALPQTFDTTYAPNGGATITVNAGQSLQAAIDSAARGDTIVVQAGSSFAPVTLPSKAGTGWVHIRSSALASLPASGTRVGPSNAANMPKILTSGSGAAVSVPSGAQRYRLIGLEIGFTGSGDNYGIVQLDDGGPDDIVFDRCYIHGSPNGHIKFGIRLSGSRNAVIDSHLNQIHARNGVFEGHGIDGFNGPGPLKIVNCHVEAACENIIFGGATGVGGVNQDLEIRRNLLTKPMSWHPDDPSFAGTAWDVKNLLELKHGVRVLIDGNVFEHVWPSDPSVAGGPQNGWAVLVWASGDSSGTMTDVTITNNVFRDVHAGMNVYAGANRVRIANNLFDNVGDPRMNNSRSSSSADKDGRILQSLGASNVNFDHNTCIHGGADGALAWTDGFHRLANSIGRNDVNWGGGTFTKNVLVGGGGVPAGNYSAEAYSNVGFTDLAGKNYRLAATSPFKNQATDGKDIGVDFDQLNAAQGGGTTPPPPPAGDPVVSFTYPAGGAALTGTVAINARANDSDAGPNDGDGIAQVAFELVQGATVVAGRTEMSATYDWPLDTTTVADGTYTLRATATSTAAAGGTSTTVSISVAVANTGPPPPPPAAEPDSLPDAWEMQHFGGLGQTDNGDPDQDGFNNLAEYQAGTDPMDPASVPGGGGPGPQSSGEGSEGCGALGLEALLLAGWARGGRRWAVGGRRSSHRFALRLSPNACRATDPPRSS
jgi:hypothetical protein